MPDLEQLEELVPKIVEIMRSHPDVPNTFGEPGPVIWLKNFPSGSCDISSLTIASALYELGLGDWELVSAFDERGQGHTWLRLRVAGQIMMSIDATIHQFNEWDEPWVGYGDSPAAARFIHPRHEYRLTTVPSWWPRGHELEVATWTREKIRDLGTVAPDAAQT
jgi:hypothetical protein